MSATPGPVRRQLEYLLNGFDFYGHRERLAEDDRLVRLRAAEGLGRALAHLRRAEALARAALPTPTRERPWPDASALARVRDLEAVAQAVADAEARVRALPLPHLDRTWERLRSSAAALELLLEHDLGLVGAADRLAEHARAVAEDPAGAPLGPVREALAAFEAALQARQADLEAPVSPA